jgi:hypothetical protein
MLAEERFEKAVSHFLEGNAWAASQISQLSPQVAEHLGMDFTHYKKQNAARLFAEYAISLGKEVQIFVFELTANSGAELHELKSRYYRTLADTLGMTWEEYVSHNPHLSCY